MVGRLRLYGRIAAATVLVVLLASCAFAPPAPVPLPAAPDVSGIHAFLREHQAEDARFQSVVDRPFLKVDLPLRYTMRDYPTAADAETRRTFVIEFLQRAAATGERAVNGALDRVAPAEIVDFNTAHGVAVTGDPYEALVAAYRTDLVDRLRHEVETVAGLDRGEAVDHYWRELTAAIEESIMTRGRLVRQLLNAPAVPVIDGWIAYHNWHDYRGPLTPDFAASQVFTLGDSHPRPADVSAGDWDLLKRYAPVLVQETATDPEYPQSYDHFGAVALNGADLDSAQPAVDPTQPAVYAYIERKTIQGVKVLQLNYTIWYPRHPAMSFFDPEAGALDGWTVRISLDRAGRPQVVESVSNCGCYYKIFPSESLESASRERFPARLPDKGFHLEQHVADGVDAVVPETIPGLDTEPYGITVYMSAGHHQLISIRAASVNDPAATGDAQAYLLAAYEELEHLPFKDHKASLFGPDGLVRRAHRSECNLLSPSGVYHAGHPRQRETQMIYFDQADLEDPGLLEHYLRLPPAAFGSGA